MLVCAFLCAFLHTRPRVQRAPGIPCSLFKGECLCKPRANRAARRRSYVRKWQRKHHTLAVVPDKRAPIRDPYAVAVIIERAGGRLSLNDSGRWLWVPAQGRDDKEDHRARPSPTKQSIFCTRRDGLLRGARHRAALCADSLARNDSEAGCFTSPTPRWRRRPRASVWPTALPRRGCCPPRSRQSRIAATTRADRAARTSPPPPAAA
jgi:hypothetical protein